jgi:hypothetical protein
MIARKLDTGMAQAISVALQQDHSRRLETGSHGPQPGLNLKI